MRRSRRVGRLPGVVVCAAVLCSVIVLWTPVWLAAAESQPAEPLPKGDVVDLFRAIEKGQIEVQLIPRDSRQCRLLIDNKTGRPLSVQLPASFGAVPVLAQQFPNPGRNGLQQGNASQQLGVGPGFPPMRPGIMNVGPNQGFPNQGFPNQGFPNQGFPNQGFPNQGVPNRPGPNPFQFPGPIFSVPAEKVGKFRLPSVCLEYGKAEPRPRLKYQIKPIDQVTEKPGVAELCEMLGQGQISQRAAQLAAWHLNNDMSWEELAKVRQKMALGTRPVYTPKELKSGKKAAEAATKLAEQRQHARDDKADSLSSG
ncbi:MAG: hypothetical protein JXB62_02060 [Pirellulales bacterium]|nr:hypothetical protein [Pirellulales bacterium]